MKVEKGDLYKHVNEEEAYSYEVVDIFNNTNITEDYCYITISLKNLKSDTVFQIRGDKFERFYESQKVRTVAQTTAKAGDVLASLEDDTKYACTRAWMWDLYDMAYELKNLHDGTLKEISCTDLEKYRRLPPPGTFPESRAHELEMTLVMLLKTFESIKPTLPCDLSPWIEKTSSTWSLLTYPVKDIDSHKAIKDATQQFGRCIRKYEFRLKLLQWDGNQNVEFIKDLFYDLSIRFLCD